MCQACGLNFCEAGFKQLLFSDCFVTVTLTTNVTICTGGKLDVCGTFTYGHGKQVCSKV